MGQVRTAMMRSRRELAAERPGLRLGFTLTELIVVMAIIGIIITLILTAAMDGVRRAEERATESLIIKLETGLNDRLDALLQTRPDPNWAHFYLSAIYPGGTTVIPAPGLVTAPSPPSTTRGQVIAWYDFLKSEIPDVFFTQLADPNYKINFAGVPYPGPPGPGTGYDNVILPLGNSIPTASFGDYNPSYSTSTGTGIFGASYYAAAGIYKNLGYLPQGYDGVDNGGVLGLVDDWGEGVISSGPNANSAQVLANLNAHQQHTARSEMLYALLVEGQGPLGSVFNRDDFTDKEVRDTDGDGLPEFVDAWGQPLQFFRWPVLYHSDFQRGQVIIDDTTTGLPALTQPYASVFDTREQDPLDPNQQLMAPAWWSTYNASFPMTFTGTAGSVGGSGGVLAFEYFFHRLTEPLQNTGNSQFYWDRSSPVYPQGTLGFRRAFFSKPLIVSSGLDQHMGVFVYPDGTNLNSSMLLGVENNALQFDPGLFNGGETIQPIYWAIQPNSNSYNLREAGRDDISNHNLQSTSGGGGP